MANFSSTYPSTRPVFNADFSNAGRLDSRITFSRSDTPPTYAAPSAVHYWSNEKHLSSENLLTYSNPNNAAWNESNGATVTTNAAAAPDGTTTASSIVEDSANSQHRTFISVNASSGETYTLVAYLKANGRTIAQVATSGASAAANVEFDLSGSGTATTRSGSPANSSISQIGSTGWYKCSFQVTAGSTATLYLNVYLCDSANSNSYTGDGSSGVYAYGFNLSTIGQLVHEDTSGQIARSYAPTLKSVSTAGQPRFEYSPTDSASMGLLIEGSSTNLIAYSDDLTNAWWDSGAGVNKDSNVAVGPDGTLTADMLRLDSSTGSHYIRRNAVTVAASTSHTLSTYVKPVGNVKCKLTAFENGGDYTSEISVIFDLSGSGSVQQAIIGSGTITALSNGWFRITATGTTDSTSSSVQIAVMDNTGGGSFAGDGYSGLLLAKLQYEASSFASSPISTNGSAVTRAADSASMDLTQAGFNGGPFSIVSETDGGLGAYPRAWVITDGTASESVAVYKSSANASSSTNWHINAVSGGADTVLSSIPSSAAAGKLAVSFDTNDVSFCASGGTVTTDASSVIPSGLDTLRIGVLWNGNTNQLNGHCKRIALYSEALSDSNLQSLTK